MVPGYVRPGIAGVAKNLLSDFYEAVKSLSMLTKDMFGPGNNIEVFVTAMHRGYRIMLRQCMVSPPVRK